jgi:hypothetical protein
LATGRRAPISDLASEGIRDVRFPAPSYHGVAQTDKEPALTAPDLPAANSVATPEANPTDQLQDADVDGFEEDPYPVHERIQRDDALRTTFNGRAKK